MKNFLLKYAYKTYVTSKVVNWIYKNDFVWLNEKHHQELAIILPKTIK